ncbi:hypothetical protein [Nocardia sp. CY41]|uniref:hypothetical protein n=1 Tax=Nocardia sp. CY41 TaxID=2608686 RepID=UPI001356D3A6|nr:hypothetical protein [Nocardia sp. CY41]
MGSARSRRASASDGGPGRARRVRVCRGGGRRITTAARRRLRRRDRCCPLGPITRLPGEGDDQTFAHRGELVQGGVEAGEGTLTRAGAAFFGQHGPVTASGPSAHRHPDRTRGAHGPLEGTGDRQAPAVVRAVAQRVVRPLGRLLFGAAAPFGGDLLVGAHTRPSIGVRGKSVPWSRPVDAGSTARGVVTFCVRPRPGIPVDKESSL